MRIGVVGIVINNNSGVVKDVQSILSDHSNIILGRMGVPDKQNGVNTIALIVKGTVDEISSLTGRLGRLSEVSVKSALSSLEVE